MAYTDSSLRNFGPAAPHGPNMTGEHTASENVTDKIGDIHHMNQNEKDIFNHLILPVCGLRSTVTYRTG